MYIIAIDHGDEPIPIGICESLEIASEYVRVSNLLNKGYFPLYKLDTIDILTEDDIIKVKNKIEEKERKLEEKRENRKTHKCSGCGRTSRKAWSICPYCGAKLMEWI